MNLDEEPYMAADHTSSTITTELRRILIFNTEDVTLAMLREIVAATEDVPETAVVRFIERDMQIEVTLTHRETQRLDPITD